MKITMFERSGVTRARPLPSGATHVIVALAAALGGCIGPVVEPVAEEDYWVRNETAESLSVEATHPWGEGPVTLLSDTVPAGETVHVHHVIEGSGGHTFPSNFFETFTVRAGDTVIYDEVDDADWAREPDLGLVLTLSP